MQPERAGAGAGQQPFADPENPTYEECKAAGFHHIAAGKQCPHPASIWFRDPRPSPPPLRSRKAILTEIYRNHTCGADSKRFADILEHYYLPGEKTETEDEEAEASFPQFGLLPAEIRQQIWQLALPRRILDMRETRHHNDFLGIRHVALPVPSIARVCREARDVVMRLGTRLSVSGCTERTPPSRNKAGIAGFFVKGSDIALHTADNCYFDAEDFTPLEKDKNGDGCREDVCTASTITQSMSCQAAAVCFLSAAALDSPYTTSILGSQGGFGGGANVWLQPWTWLKENPGPTLETVYVYYRSRYIDVSLRVGTGFPKQPEEDTTAIPGGIDVQLLVDLYDDQRLAELHSLETLHADEGIKGDLPRYAASGARNPGLCLNCERVQWEEHVKPQVLVQWLLLHADELDGDTLGAVFISSGDTLGAVFIGSGDSSSPPWFDVDHPWVKEKLRAAPEFRPAVLVHLYVAEEALLREEGYSEWDDYYGRTQALR